MPESHNLVCFPLGRPRELPIGLHYISKCDCRLVQLAIYKATHLLDSQTRVSGSYGATQISKFLLSLVSSVPRYV